MQARIKNPALSVHGALDALRQLGMSATGSGIPETTLYLLQLRAGLQLSAATPPARR